jgi:endoglucanase
MISIAIPLNAGTYKLCVVNSQGVKLGESAALLRVSGGGSYVRFRNAVTGLYIDGMGSTSNGSNACQWGNSGSANQQWTQETAGNYVRFKNRATGLYLDGMGSTGNGSDLCQWNNSGSANQQWQIE